MSQIPDAIKSCMDVLSHSRAPVPGFFPSGQQAAAKWWIEQMQEPCGRDEMPRQIGTIGTDGAQRWVAPYVDRVTLCLAKFLSMRYDDQLEIVTCVTEQRVPWRGDDHGTYRLIVDAAARMRTEGKETIRNEARARFRTMRANWKKSAR